MILFNIFIHCWILAILAIGIRCILGAFIPAWRGTWKSKIPLTVLESFVAGSIFCYLPVCFFLHLNPRANSTAIPLLILVALLIIVCWLGGLHRRQK